MKKLILPVLAIGAISTLASCSSEEPLGPGANDGKVTFNICLEGAQTRAFGETTDCNEIYYTVFDMDGNVVLADEHKTAFGPGVNTATVELQLVANQQYQVIFYAHNNNSTFSSYANGVVSVNYGNGNIHVNSNVDDAFINKQTYTPAGATEALPNQVFTADGNAKTVYLTRPFAQVNFGTNDLNNTAVQNILDNVSTEFTVSSGLYSTYSVLEEKAETEYTGAYTATTGKPQENTDFPVGGYSNLLSVYLLTAQTQDMIDATYTINLAGKPAINNLNLANMPVQGNYRTNVYGSLLTTQNDFNVVIEPNFGTPDFNKEIKPVSTVEELYTEIGNAQDGDVFQPTQNLNLSESGILNVDKDITIDIPAGITLTTARQTNTANITVAAGKTLKLTGNGTMSGDNRLVDVDGNLIVDGPTFTATTNNRGSIFSVNPGAKMTIESGTLNTPYIALWVDGEAEINGGTIQARLMTVRSTGKTTINGGTFINTSSNSNGNDPNDWSYGIRTMGPDSEIIINGGTFTGVQGIVSTDQGGKVTINDGVFSTHNSEAGKKDGFYCVYATENGIVTINGGYFHGANEWSTVADGLSCIVSGDNDVNNPTGTLVINGGYMSGKAYQALSGKPQVLVNLPKGYKYEACEEVKDGMTFTWKVVKE